MPPESALDFRHARVTLVSALAWRVVAELFRRYRDRYDLRVLQVHPGISKRGSLYLTTPTPAGVAAPCLSLDLGGASGTYAVLRRFDDLPARPGGMSDVPYAGPMLASDPSTVIDEIAAAWGLPRRERKLAASDRTTLVVRTIAGLLEKLVFQRVSWRTTAGYCDNSAVGPMVPDWTALLGVSGETISNAKDGSDISAADALAQYVLLHQTDSDNICLRLHDLKGTAWAFCLKSGIATRLTSRGLDGVVELPRRYEELRRRADALVNELAIALA